MPTAPVANRPINLSAMDLIAAAISGPTCSKRKKTERVSSAPAKRLAMLLSATEVTAGSIAGARIHLPAEWVRPISERPFRNDPRNVAARRSTATLSLPTGGSVYLSCGRKIGRLWLCAATIS